MRKHWMLDELKHAGPEHLDTGFVAGYNRKQGFPDPTEDIGILRKHGLGETSTIVDIGAGTGQFALDAARVFGRVIAVDVSPAMLAHVRARAADADLPRLECVQGGFLTYEHTGPPADAVFTRNALHQLPDFWKAVALQRVAGMMRPGGVLRLRDLIYSFEPQEIDSVFERWFAGAAEDPAAGYTSDDYVEHIQNEHSTFSWLLEPLLDRCGFDIVESDLSGLVFGSYTCIRR
ncbi:methyltransferase domain-containing protein [Phytoactinopolyspora sp. XMNu-373]|uniref:Methyltransferase domain-containing protein n=1 Tax=Phytoactinopolyspora mesophila TaxID=2650750 RepID=A0A7K3LYF0_9ACTN|nr:methyltransferase domain-containing protein [Phytoactinopolyspora mesophila]